MPINIVVGIFALLVALVFYSVGAIGAFRAKEMSRRHVRAVIAGILFDILATTMMAIQAGGIVNDLHTYLAFAVFFGMLAVGLLGSRALAAGERARLALLARWGLVPYALWVAVFVWGMLERGPARVG